MKRPTELRQQLGWPNPRQMERPMPRAFNSLSSRNKFARRQYEAIAQLIQEVVLSDDELNEEELVEVERRRRAIASQFADLFAGDNGQFQRERFIRACEPGANVRARS
jgi:tetrahydrodipicolinate N-succinyltransferase